VAKPDKFFGQVGNDPFGAAIEARRNALNEGSNLGDFHDVLVLSSMNTNACNAAKFRSAHKTGFNKAVCSDDRYATPLVDGEWVVTLPC
jgi:hypothetical protein